MTSPSGKIFFAFCVTSCRGLLRDVHRTSQLPAEPAAKYCTYAVDGGFNNRLQALQIALLVCQATKRTLIVQPFTLGHNDGEEVPYTYFLEPIVEMPTVLSSNIHTAMLTVEDIDLYGNDCKVSLSEVGERYAGSDAEVLRFPDYWGYWESMFQKSDHGLIKTTLGKLIRFSAGINAGANLLVQWLAQQPGSWSAAHARLTDRQGLVLLDCDQVGLAVASPDLLGRTDLSDAEEGAIADGCALELPNGSLLINDIETGFATFPAAGVRNVYIATDNPEDSRLTRIHESLQLRGVSSLLWEDFPASLRDQAIAHANQKQLAFSSYAQVEQLVSRQSSLTAILFDLASGSLTNAMNSTQYLNTSRDLSNIEPPDQTSLGQELSDVSEELARAKHDLPQRNGAFVSCIEEVVCMAAYTFLPSWPSSWDATVIDKRLLSGRTDGEKLMNLMHDHLMKHLEGKAHKQCRRPVKDVVLKIGRPENERSTCESWGYSLRGCLIYQVLDWHKPGQTIPLLFGVFCGAFVFILIYRGIAFLRGALSRSRNEYQVYEFGEAGETGTE